MIKLLIVARRAAGRTRKGALDHLRDVHAKMVVCAPPDAGPMPLDYVQNHVLDGAYPGSGVHAIERDLVTELWFESVAHLHASTATPYYLENLRPDEPRFVDDPTVAKMMVRATVLREGKSGAFKTFVFASRGDDTDDATWARARGALTTAFTAAAGIVAVTENAVLAPPTGERPFVDIVLEGWFLTRAAAATALNAAITHLAGPEADGTARERSFAVIAEEYDTLRLRALHGCPAAS